MKSTMLAAALAALSVVTAHAAEFFSPPAPLEETKVPRFAVGALGDTATRE